MPLRREAAHVPLHEYHAPLARDRRRHPGGDLGAPLQGDPHPSSLLLDEAPRPGGAGVVHDGVDDPAAGEAGELAVLASDLEDRVDLGLEVKGAGGVGGDLVEIVVGVEGVGDELPARTGGADAVEGERKTLPGGELECSAEEPLGRLDRGAFGPGVEAGRRTSLGIEEESLGRPRAHVDAEGQGRLPPPVEGHLRPLEAPRLGDVGLRRRSRRDRPPALGGCRLRADPVHGPGSRPGETGRPHRHDELRIGRRGEPLSDDRFHSLSQRRHAGDPADHHEGGGGAAAPEEELLKTAGHTPTEAGGHRSAAVPRLEEVDEVGPGEDRAPGRHARPVARGGRRESAERLQGEAEGRRLLLEEEPRPRGARSVDGVPHGAALPVELHQGAPLAADEEDCPGLGEAVAGAGNGADDLVEGGLLPFEL